MIVDLLRLKYTNKGTYGVMMTEERPICTTLEPPWDNNKTNVSCIPVGEYEVGPYSSKKYPGVWILKDVPSRELILIHKGNFLKDTQGCILAGQTFTEYGVGASRMALDELRGILPQEFKLRISEL